MLSFRSSTLKKKSRYGLFIASCLLELFLSLSFIFLKYCKYNCSPQLSACVNNSNIWSVCVSVFCCGFCLLCFCSCFVFSVCVFGYINLIPEIYGCFFQISVQLYQSGIILVRVQGSGFPGLRWYKFGVKDCGIIYYGSSLPWSYSQLIVESFMIEYPLYVDPEF